MASATSTLDPSSETAQQAFSTLGRFCMDHLPDSARDEFISLYKQSGDAWLDALASDVRLLKKKNELISRYKSQSPFPFSPNQRS